MLPSERMSMMVEDEDELADAGPDDIAFVLQSVAELAVHALGADAVQSIVTAAIEQDGKAAN